ncbi:MAG: class I tRNA ligase family protein, partial [Candidatus Promineifilaceae bacterium]|nr:class I tRNA ligase family protein [Candidatus Promineifilaceae bacterium]
YGSGAVMGVPAHDSRDFAFAQKYGLPIVPVVAPTNGVAAPANQAYTEPGVMINSGQYDGLPSDQGGARVTADLAARGLGGPQVVTKMRDWLISRQRYWGAPIPIIHCPACGVVPVPESQLPVLLPHIDEFAPGADGRSPLAEATDWVNTDCPQCGGAAQRETDTMDGFACSSWYFLRFASPDYEDGPFDPEAMRAWLPVDTYVGGAEHAVMHLLYARFWTKVMYDAGLVPFAEPFSQLRNQGMLHAADGQRMSKSKGNVVTPDEVAAAHGTDALRTYILFIGPFEGDVIWDDGNIKGVDRFLERLWALAQELDELGATEADPAREDKFRREHHRLIKRVTADLEKFKFNTAVASFMAHLNYLEASRDAAIGPTAWREALGAFVRLLAPIAPFISEEIWQEVLGHTGQSVHLTSWPEYDEILVQRQEIEVMIQVNGKLRDRITVPADIADNDLEQAALAQDNVQRHLVGKTVRRTIIVPQRLINVVAN